MYSTSDFRNGLKILVDDAPVEIVYFQHVKPGKGGAFIRTKLKNLITGAVVEKTFRSGEKVGVPDIEDTELQFLYSDESQVDCDNAFHFMHSETFEQIAVSVEVMGDNKDFLKESMNVRALVYNGEIISVELPVSVVLEIVECDPGLKGDTVSGATKSAKLETGATLQVPLFVNVGEKIRVDTRTKEYMERA